jgi:L-cysteine S-thiosulfotransferase
MLSKIVTGSLLIGLSCTFASAANYNAQAEKDRVALVKYMEAKFKSPDNDAKFFPNSTDFELHHDFIYNFPFQDFGLGVYGFVKSAKEQYENFKMLPPYDDAISSGEALFHKKFANGKTFASCFPNPAITNTYPKFDDAKNEVITLSMAVNNCLVSNGEKPWNLTKSKMAHIEAYMADATTQAGKKFDIKIQSAEAAKAYERGKIEYYSQRGYLDMSCATCHVQGAGKRVRADYLTPLLGDVVPFPAYRLKWGYVGTIEKRIVGCNKDQGENPHKPDGKWMADLLYFMGYMSNGLKVNAPDIRK